MTAKIRLLGPEQRFEVEEDGNAIGYVLVTPQHIAWGELSGPWHTVDLKVFADFAKAHGKPLSQAINSNQGNT